MIIFSDMKITHEIIKTQIVDNTFINCHFTGFKIKIHATLVYIVDNRRLEETIKKRRGGSTAS